MQTELSALEHTAIDSNEEYIEPSNVSKQPSVLSSIFKSIFVETPKDFFAGILNFFARYMRHFIDGIKFFWKPSLRVAPFETKDFKEDAQRSFEFSLIATAILIFMIKQDFIPVNEHLQEQYGNDIIQMFFEFAIFLFFGTAYLVLILISVLIGRLFRLLFRIKTSRKENDILFSYLNNSLFSISVLIAFIFRCGIQGREVEEDLGFFSNVISFFLVIYLPLILIWSIRFSKLNAVSGFRKLLFIAFSTFLFTLFFGITAATVTFFVLGT